MRSKGKHSSRDVRGDPSGSSFVKCVPGQGVRDAHDKGLARFSISSPLGHFGLTSERALPPSVWHASGVRDEMELGIGVGEVLGSRLADLP